MADRHGNSLHSSVVFSFATPALDGKSLSTIVHLRHRARPVLGRFQMEAPVGLPLVLRASAASGAGQSELVHPVPGQPHDLGDIILRPVSSPQPETGLPQP